MRAYNESKLKNGLTIITSENSSSDVVTFSAWVRAGSRYEENNENGYAHILEHMLLKGTKSRPSIFNLNVVLDRVGAYSNAATNNEMLRVEIQVSKNNFEEIFDLLADIILNPALDDNVLTNEKKVIIQEIQRAYDNHSTRLWIESIARVFKGHPLLNYPLGSTASVNSAKIEKLFSYYKKFFMPNNMLVVACGAVEHKKLANLCEEKFGAMAEGAIQNNLSEFQINTGSGYEKMPGSQTHVRFNFSGPKLAISESVILDVITNFLGYKQTSLLYQKLRHEAGIVYSVSVTNSFFQDANLFSISTASTNPREVISIISDKVFNLEKYFSKELFDEYKKQFVNVLVRKMNDEFAEMNFLGGYWIVHNRLVSPEEIIKVANKVSYEDMIRVKNQYLTKENLFIMILGENEVEI